jgi:hypothetical protein
MAIRQPLLTQWVWSGSVPSRIQLGPKSVQNAGAQLFDETHGSFRSVDNLVEDLAVSHFIEHQTGWSIK